MRYLVGTALVVAAATALVLSTRPETPADTPADAPVTTLGQAISDIAPAERDNFKASRINTFVKKGVLQDISFSRARYRVEIVKTIVFDGGIDVYARAWLPNGQQIGFGADGTIDVERFRVINPPLYVEDQPSALVDDGFGSTTIRHATFKEDPEAALLQTLVHTISVKKEKFGPERIVPGKEGNTTSTFYPSNPGSGTNSVCGYIGRENNSESWATMRGNTTAEYQGEDDSTPGYNGPQLYSSGGFRGLDRIICVFDTSSLPDADSVSSATFSLYRSDPASLPGGNPDSISYSVVSSTPASNDAIVAEDFDQLGSTTFATENLADFLSVEGYVDWSLDASGIANISVSGSSKYGLRGSPDLNNSEPTGVNRFGLYYAGATGTSNDPKLVVEHSSVPIEPIYLRGAGRIYIQGGAAFIR